MAQSVEEDMQAIKKGLLKHNIPADKVDTFLAHCEEQEYDYNTIKFDIEDADPTQTLLYDLIREDLGDDMKIFDILRSACHLSPSNTENIDTSTKDAPESKEADCAPVNIVNGSLVYIPDEIPFNLYETVQGIDWLLKNEKNQQLIKQQFGEYDSIFWDFWEEFNEDYNVSFDEIYTDLHQHNREGHTIFCITEHPPSERALPILERIVDELKLPRLSSAAHADKESKQVYKQLVAKFYETHLPRYQFDDAKDDILHSSVLCKCNEHDSKLNDMQFELLPTLLDIWDRMHLQCESDVVGVHSIEQMIDEKQNDDEKHYASRLNVTDATKLRSAIIALKNGADSVFSSLHGMQDKINGNLRQYQLLTLAFIKFIKAFICVTQDDLHQYNHTRRRKKKKKIEKSRLEFNNNNFPLQFDLVILNEDNDAKQQSYFFSSGQTCTDKNAYIRVVEENLPVLQDDKYKEFVDGVKGEMVSAFHKLLYLQKLDKKSREQASNTKGKKRLSSVQKQMKDREKKRDHRYVIVLDCKQQKLYLYAPYFYNLDNNGKKVMVKHRKKINTQLMMKSDEDEDNDDVSEQEHEKQGNKIGDSELADPDHREMVENRFSLIGYEANELTNFYLTSQCLIPSSIHRDEIQQIKLYGVKDFEFVFSAHFHVQKEWYLHPKLKFYQYFNGRGLRFFRDDMVTLWSKYFNLDEDGQPHRIDDLNEDIGLLFDDTLDLQKCDEVYRKWRRAVKIGINGQTQSKK